MSQRQNLESFLLCYGKSRLLRRILTEMQRLKFVSEWTTTLILKLLTSKLTLPVKSFVTFTTMSGRIT